MKRDQAQGIRRAMRLHAGWRALAAPLGVYLWILSALMSSSAAHADDIDIYTKNLGGAAGGSVISVVANTAMQGSCSLLDANCKANTPGRFTNTLLNQINYNMKDALRAVATSAPGNLRINITDYANDGTRDVGRVNLKQTRLGDVRATVSSGGAAVSPIVKRISAGAHDAVQKDGYGVSITDDLYVGILPAGVSPYGSIITDAWTSSGGAGLAGTCCDSATNDAISDATKWQNAPANGNKVYYYKHTSATTTQTFYLDSLLATTKNPVLFLIDQSAPTAVKQYNDDRFYSSVCPVGTTGPVTTPASKAGLCKVSGSTYVSPVVTIDKNSTINATGMVSGNWYKLVVATRDAGLADTFTLKMGDSTLGEFWDTDSPVAVGALQRAGFYFPGIDIPPDADITSAKLVFTKISQNTGAGLLTNTYVGIDPDVDAQDFSVTSISARSWENESDFSWDVSGDYPELDVTDLVHKQVEQDDWCPGKALAFQVARSTGATWYMKAFSYESTPTKAVQLVITWDTSSGDASSCESNRELKLKVESMSEDVNQFSDGSMDIHKDYMPDSITATDIDRRANLWVSSTSKVGLRFPLAQIPVGAKVVSAKLKLTATSGSPQQIRVAGILNAKKGTAEAFYLDDYSLDTLNTTAEVEWNPGTWSAGSVYESPDLSSIVQAQVDQALWTNEATLGFILRGTTAAVMKACAWERNATAGLTGTSMTDFGSCAAELVLEIDDNGLPVEETGRRTVVEHIDAIIPSGLQPMGEAYLKNARYLAGKFSLSPSFGSDGVADDTPLDTAPTKPLLASGDCATNTLVYIADNGEDADLASDLDTRYSNFATSVGGSTSCSVSGVSAKACVIDTAEILYEGFVPEGATAEASLKTFTINFGATAGGSGGGEGAVDWTQSDPGSGTLRSVADNGGGAAKQASSSAQLVKQLLALITLVSDSGASVAAPGISVNALNRFEHLDQLYYSLFKPSTKVDWTGNMKRYQLKDSDVADANGVRAVGDFTNAYFASTAVSFWNSVVDGSDVTAGGAAAKNTANQRRIFTYLGDNSAIPSGGVTLTQRVDPADAVDSDGATDVIDEVVLGMDQVPADWSPGGPLETQVQREAVRLEVLNWLARTPTDSTESRWGASIHNSPRIVSYWPREPRLSVFYGDNRGLLHAIHSGNYTSTDAATNMDLAGYGGRELYAFVPQELLKNAYRLNRNTESIISDGYIYGMDGDITLERLPAQGAPNAVYLYAGMRRGGRNYYGLDITQSYLPIDDDAANEVPENVPAPKLLWVVEGGTGDYVDLGETWSAMSPNTITWNGNPRKVLVVGGGHDSSRHDDGQYGDYSTPGNTSSTGATPYTFVPKAAGERELGSVLYVINPRNGKRIWYSRQSSIDTSLPQFKALEHMKYSIVATPRLIDRNADGRYDGIYVVDLAGQVFRFDLNPAATSATNFVLQVELVAQLGATAPGADPLVDNRRFYDPPSVAFYGEDVLLALSSGYREEPGSKANQESFFFFKDLKAYSSKPPLNVDAGGNLDPIVRADLDNITSNAVTDPADATMVGWYLDFDKDDEGEKGIGSPIIFNTAVLWTTYHVQPGASTCDPSIGNTRLYLVDFLGRGITDSNITDSTVTPSRSTDINLPGLADTPQLIFREGGGIDVAVGVRINAGENLCVAGATCPFDTSVFGRLRRSRWYMVDED